VNVSRFFEVAELLDDAFAGPPATPDHLSHECELAERALWGLTAKSGSTNDLVLVELLNLSRCQEQL
jgi:hypothetical protein